MPGRSQPAHFTRQIQLHDLQATELGEGDERLSGRLQLCRIGKGHHAIYRGVGLKRERSVALRDRLKGCQRILAGKEIF